MKQNKINLYILLIIVIPLFSGCIFNNNQDNSSDNWEDEILLAKECGMDGLMCCNSDPKCFYGQTCCVDPNNFKNNYCADSCDCGKEDNFCCIDNICEDELICYNSKCKVCGNKDQPCCKNNKCSENLICHNNKCVQCGITGNPCCQNNECVNQNKNNDLRTECQKGICIFCGFNGNIACNAEPRCNLENLFNNNFCYKCGEQNQPCCALNKCNKNLKCQLGFCIKN